MDSFGGTLDLERRLRRVKRLARLRASGTGPVPSPERILAGARAALGYGRDEHARNTLAPVERLRLLGEVRHRARAWLRTEAEAIVKDFGPADDADRGKALPPGMARAVQGFFDKASRYLQNALTAAALALGGPRDLSRAERESLEKSHAVQQKYLDAFRDEALSVGPPFLDGRFPARAEQYGGSTWTAAQNAEVVRNLEAGRRQAKRVHRGTDSPCETCQNAINLGWVPLADLPPLGDCLGMNNCHCVVLFRDGPGDGDDV